MGFEDDLLSDMAEAYEKQLEESDIQCPYEGCSGTTIDAEISVDRNGRFEGEALCLSCNQIFELDIEDSQARDAVGDVTDAVDDLMDTLDDF